MLIKINCFCFVFFRAERKVGINNGGTGSIGSSSSGLGSSGGLLSGGDSEINGSDFIDFRVSPT